MRIKLNLVRHILCIPFMPAARAPFRTRFVYHIFIEKLVETILYIIINLLDFPHSVLFPPVYGLVRLARGAKIRQTTVSPVKLVNVALFIVSVILVFLDDLHEPIYDKSELVTYFPLFQNNISTLEMLKFQVQNKCLQLFLMLKVDERNFRNCAFRLSYDYLVLKEII